MSRQSAEDMRLAVEAGGLRLANPFVVASGPTSKAVEQLVEAERAGWAGVSTKLTMDPAPEVRLPPRYRWLGEEGMHVFTAESRLGLDEGLALIEQGRKRTQQLVLFANIVYAGTDGPAGWARMAKRFERAGAHVIELNLCCPNMAFNVGKCGDSDDSGGGPAAMVCTDPVTVGEITGAVKGACKIPVFAKLSAEGSNVAELAAAALAGGADGVISGANRLGMPPFRLTDPSSGFYRAQRGLSLGCVSGPVNRPWAQRDVFEIRRLVGPEACIVGTGGVSTADDAIRMTMCGADLIGVCTAIMIDGPGWLGREMRKVREFLDDSGFGNWRQLRDEVHKHMRPAHELEILEGHAVVDESTCTGCRRCLQIGHCCAIDMTADDKARIDPALCTACSTCIDLCKAGAIRMVETDERG